MKARDIKTKRVWKRVMPSGYLSQSRFSSIEEPSSIPEDNLTFMTVTQADFLRVPYPSGPMLLTTLQSTLIFIRKKGFLFMTTTAIKIGKRRARFTRNCFRGTLLLFSRSSQLNRLFTCAVMISVELNIENPTDEEENASLNSEQVG